MPKIRSHVDSHFAERCIEAGNYLSHLQPFWLDAIAPLTAILEDVEAGELIPEHVYAATQLALVLIGNTVQEKHNVHDPTLKSLADEENVFQQAA